MIDLFIAARALRTSLNESRHEAECMFRWGLDHEQHEARYTGERVIRPNETGIKLLVLWERWIAAPIIIYCMETCGHENMRDESYGGPESGAMCGECPDCGFSYHHTLY